MTKPPTDPRVVLTPDHVATCDTIITEHINDPEKAFETWLLRDESLRPTLYADSELHALAALAAMDLFHERVKKRGLTYNLFDEEDD